MPYIHAYIYMHTLQSWPASFFYADCAFFRALLYGDLRGNERTKERYRSAYRCYIYIYTYMYTYAYLYLYIYMHNWPFSFPFADCAFSEQKNITHLHIDVMYLYLHTYYFSNIWTSFYIDMYLYLTLLVPSLQTAPSPSTTSRGPPRQWKIKRTLQIRIQMLYIHIYIRVNTFISISYA